MEPPHPSVLKPEGVFRKARDHHFPRRIGLSRALVKPGPGSPVRNGSLHGLRLLGSVVHDIDKLSVGNRNMPVHCVLHKFRLPRSLTAAAAKNRHFAVLPGDVIRVIVASEPILLMIPEVQHRNIRPDNSVSLAVNHAEIRVSVAGDIVDKCILRIHFIQQLFPVLRRLHAEIFPDKLHLGKRSNHQAFHPLVIFAFP